MQSIGTLKKNYPDPQKKLKLKDMEKEQTVGPAWNSWLKKVVELETRILQLERELEEAKKEIARTKNPKQETRY